MKSEEKKSKIDKWQSLFLTEYVKMQKNEKLMYMKKKRSSSETVNKKKLFLLTQLFDRLVVCDNDKR